MTTSTAPAAALAPVFLPLVPEYFGPALPTCPDGSGDLWWDDASYARYQAFDPDYRPAFIDAGETPGYCEGPDRPFGTVCPCHVPDLPF